MSASPQPAGRYAWPATRVTLIERICNRQDPNAWQVFVTVYRPLIYRYCCRRGLQDADAQDVAQNVMCRIRAALPHFKYDPQRGRFRGWLGTITRREMRRQQLQQQAALCDGTTCQAHVLEALGDVTDPCDHDWTETFYTYAMQVALERIRPEFTQDMWQAFDAIWFHDLTPAETAAKLHRPPAWVYHVKYRILRRLKEVIVPLLDDVARVHQ